MQWHGTGALHCGHVVKFKGLIALWLRRLRARDLEVRRLGTAMMLYHIPEGAAVKPLEPFQLRSKHRFGDPTKIPDFDRLLKSGAWY